MPVVSHCPIGQIFINDGARCCQDITCSPGEQPLMCSLDDPSSTKCEDCPPGTFNPDKAVLSAGDKCNLRTLCIGPNMKYRKAGNSVTDAVCECKPGYHLSDEQMHCDRNEPCPRGSGHDLKGGCVACSPGWFSDRKDRDQVCQKHTNCFDNKKCVLENGTDVSDTKCGEWSSSPTGQPGHDRVCIEPRNATVPVFSSTHSPNHLQDGLSRGSQGSRMSDAEIAGICIGGVALFLVLSMLIAWCRKRRRISASRRTRNRSAQSIVNRHRTDIIENLNPVDIIDELIENGVVNNEDYQRIRGHVTRQEQNRELLDVIQRQGFPGYEHFLCALRSKVSYLANIIEEGNELSGDSN